MKFIASIALSIVLIAIALTLYYLANRNSTVQSHYQTSISLARQIQQLDASWSVETARVEADPLADFDSLAAFIPQMSLLKEELSDAVRRIPTIPSELSNDVSSYVSALEAKEERVERFKTGYVVVRNSVRYLPLAATNLIRLVNEADDQRLAERVSRLTRDINAYLTIPTQAEQERLTAQLVVLRDESVTHPPQIANTLANFVAHAEVLVARKIATDEIFEEATGADISRRTDRIVSDMEFAGAQAAETAQFFQLGMFGALAALLVMWAAMGVLRVAESRGVRRSPDSDSPSVDPPLTIAATRTDPRRARELASASTARTGGEPAPSPLLPQELPVGVATPAPPGGRPSSQFAPRSVAFGADVADSATVRAPVHSGAPDARRRGVLSDRSSTATPTESEARRDLAVRPAREAKALNRVVTGFLSNSLTDHMRQFMARLDHLQQSQGRIREVVESGGLALSSGVDFDEEIEANLAVLASVRQQIEEISALAARLASFSAQRDGEASYELVNIESCVSGACEAAGVDTYASVTTNFEQVPDFFASRFDILLLIQYIVENAVWAVRGLNGRNGMIKIDVARRNDDILITVVDNGEGFEADQKSKIFEPFYTTREDALGIGLPAAVHLADKYRGTVSANSLPGEGTVFRITLPAGVTGEIVT